MSVWPAWAVREGERATRWFHVRLVFADGARVEGLVTVSEDGVGVEDLRARPALSLDDLAAFADWIEEPLARAWGGRPPGPGARPRPRPARRPPPRPRRARTRAPPRGAGRPLTPAAALTRGCTVSRSSSD
ncbi:DUF6214 family protein, partial [Streptomyces sp. NPDC059515]|uniref:DUF6214 family protein n=1 Tax=Streptomyces sp. NPDC059515 TaxID=3346854 RepID=UPI0036C1701F